MYGVSMNETLKHVSLPDGKGVWEPSPYVTGQCSNPKQSPPPLLPDHIKRENLDRVNAGYALQQEEFNRTHQGWLDKLHPIGKKLLWIALATIVLTLCSKIDQYNSRHNNEALIKQDITELDAQTKTYDTTTYIPDAYGRDDAYYEARGRAAGRHFNRYMRGKESW
jgi:hypothetical protein